MGLAGWQAGRRSRGDGSSISRPLPLPFQTLASPSHPPIPPPHPTPHTLPLPTPPTHNTDLTRYNVPHLEYLTPPHLRKGKGGRQPAADPRLDPRIDPKKARRILANRLSAAKSKMKQKSSTEVGGWGG